MPILRLTDGEARLLLSVYDLWQHERLLLSSAMFSAGGRTGETIGLSVVLATNVSDREIERPSQFPADPIQGIKPRTAASVLATHLPHHDFGI